MDVNVTTDVKGYGTPAVSTVEMEDVQKPSVQPVSKSSDGATVNLNDQALHGRKATKEEEQEKKGELTRAEWKKSLAGPRVTTLFAMDDPGPWVSDLFRRLVGRLKRMLKGGG